MPVWVKIEDALELAETVLAFADDDDREYYVAHLVERQQIDDPRHSGVVAYDAGEWLDGGGHLVPGDTAAGIAAQAIDDAVHIVGGVEALQAVIDESAAE